MSQKTPVYSYLETHGSQPMLPVLLYSLHVCVAFGGILHIQRQQYGHASMLHFPAEFNH
ncbi:hypothetical protein BDR05DRAFT_959714 [Suillus weaverae]|nr:hypothetical protein BDR05DRAFT_959714 [Suillus weaverae]